MKKIFLVAAAVGFLAACSTDPLLSSGVMIDGSSSEAAGENRGPGNLVATETGKPGSFTEALRAADTGDLVTSEGDGDTVLFDYDSHVLSARGMQTVVGQAAVMKRFPDVRVTVAGHADERGTREYNLALGARRAEAVKEALIVQGVDPHRVRTLSFGKERPVCADSTGSCWAKNRRAVTAIDR